MTKKDYGDVPQAVLDVYTDLIDSHPEIELKGSKKLPNTSVNGNMFTFVSKAGKIALRMGKDERDTFIEEHDSKLAENYGTVMKEYVEVPDDMLDDMETLSRYLEISYQYALTLKPQPRKNT